MKFLKKVAAIILAAGVGIGVYAVAGCNIRQNENNNNHQTEQTNPNNPTVDPNENTGDTENKDEEKEDNKEQEQQLLNEKVAAINAFIDKLSAGKNFTYKSGNFEALFDKKQEYDLARFNNAGVVTYLQDFGKTSFEYSLGKDNLWHKVASDKDIPSRIAEFVESTKSLKWSLDENKNLVADSDEGEVTADYQANMSSTFADDVLKLYFENGDTTIVSNLGATNVNLPNQIVDETVQDEYIYTKENGWNTQLLAKTLEDWMKKNDYFKTIAHVQNGYMERILYVDPIEDGVTYTALCYVDQKPVIQSFRFRPDLFDMVRNGLNKKDDLIEKLNKTIDGTEKIKQILLNDIYQECEYSTLDKDYETHKEEFETLTNSVINRLSDIGVQIESGDKGEINDIFKNSQIIYGFKTKAGTQNAGSNLGNKKNWNQYYLIKKDNKYQFVNVQIKSSIDGATDEKQYVLENADDDTKWIVSDVASKEVLLFEQSNNLEKSKEI